MNIFELSAKISANTEDFDKAIDSTEKKGSNLGSKLGKALKTATKVVGAASAAAVGAAATGITALTKQAVDAYGNYEQLVGGVNKIFGESAAAVMENADKAFSTAGMSANQYMETVTSFSASLIQSLGGNTVKAAEYADMAIRDMSDNANTFGTNIQSIQAAYSGFAKQNYTMLDNLKLGYGGTKSEMERLIVDAAKLSDTFSVQRDKAGNLVYGYGDIVEAIHIVQENMNITGTTAKEASDTIQGTAGSLQGAWQNLVIGLGNANTDLKPLIDNVVQSALQLVNNIKPIAIQAVQGISELIKGFAPVLAEELPPLITELLPVAVDALGMLVNSAASVVPSLIESILPSALTALTNVVMAVLNSLPTILQVLSSQLPVILQQVIPAILSLLPLLVSTGIEFIGAIGMGLAENIDLLMDAIMSIIHYIVDVMLSAENIKQFVVVALQIVLAIAGGIIKNIPEILGAIVILIAHIIEGLGTALPDIGLVLVEWIVNLGTYFGELAYDIFGSGLYDLLEGIKEWFGNIGTAIYDWATGVSIKFVTFKDNITGTIKDLWSKVTGFFSDGLNKAKETVNKVLTSIKDKFTSIFDGVKETVQKAIEFIKGLFNFSWSLPKLKMPHFKVSGGEAPWGFGGQGSLPSVKVEWYKKAMDEPYILDRATIFGSMNGTLLGGGEAGQELIIGTNKLMSMMKQAMSGVGNQPININVYGAEGQDVRELAKAVALEFQYMVDDKREALGL